MISLVANHLWQSTVFALAAALLTTMLKRNHARTRHAIWLAASVKFLIPFALLVTAGNRLQWHNAPVATPRLSLRIEQFSEPFAAPQRRTAAVPERQAPQTRIPSLMLTIWACGSLGFVLFWCRRCLRIRRAVRAASPVSGLGVRAVSSTESLEPGVFGIFRPVLLLPAGIEQRLTPEQFQTIVAHELCHIRRRDNLAALLHTAVETIFWFHPLVWWVGARLVGERERACDEEVIALGANPQVYAEGILNVCKFYLASPVKCVSGVTGSDLRKRIEEIMSNQLVHQLSRGRRLFLAALGAAAVAAPIVVGVVNTPALRAQSTNAVPPAGTPAFEVASIRPNNSTEFRSAQLQILPGGTLAYTNLPLRVVLTQAYNLPFQSPERVAGAPDWIAAQRFDIDAKPGPGAIPAGLSETKRNEKVMLMVQSLLRDRFQLKAHWETRQLPAYALTVSKSGLKLQKAAKEGNDCPEVSTPTENCHQFRGGQGQGIHGKTVSMQDMLVGLENFTDRPLIDRTEFKGLFDIDTEGWVPMRQRMPQPGAEPTAEDRAFADPARPTLQAILDKVGIRMEATKGPVQVLVVDHIERPSGN